MHELPTEESVPEAKQEEVPLKSYYESIQSLTNFFAAHPETSATGMQSRTSEQDQDPNYYNWDTLGHERTVAVHEFLDMVPQKPYLHTDLNNDNPSLATQYGLPEVDVFSKFVVENVKYGSPVTAKGAERTTSIIHVLKDSGHYREVTAESMASMDGLLNRDIDRDLSYFNATEERINNIINAYSTDKHDYNSVVTISESKKILHFYNDIEVNMISPETSTLLHSIKCSMAAAVDLFEEMKEFYGALPGNPDDHNSLHTRRDPVAEKFGRRLYFTLSTSETLLNRLKDVKEKTKEKIQRLEQVITGTESK